MLHDETRKLLIEAWNKTHNAKEIAECFFCKYQRIRQFIAHDKTAVPINNRCQIHMAAPHFDIGDVN